METRLDKAIKWAKLGKKVGKASIVVGIVLLLASIFLLGATKAGGVPESEPIRTAIFITLFLGIVLIGFGIGNWLGGIWSIRLIEAHGRLWGKFRRMLVLIGILSFTLGTYDLNRAKWVGVLGIVGGIFLIGIGCVGKIPVKNRRSSC